MSIRVDSSSLITGAVVVGVPGLGVLAEMVPSVGEQGAGYLYASLEFPEDNGKEVRGLITTWPALGTLTAFEDSSFEYDGPTDSFAFQMYVDGVAVGTPQTVTVTVGAATHEVAPVAAVAQPTASTISVQQGGQHDIVVTGAVSQPTAGTFSISQTHGASPTGASAQPAATSPSVTQAHRVVATSAITQPTASAASVQQGGQHAIVVAGAVSQPTAATVSVYLGVSPALLVVPVAAEAQPTASTVSVSQAYGLSPQPALATPVAEAITVGQTHNVGVAPATAQPAASVVWLLMPDGGVPRVALGARVQATALSGRLQ